MSNPTEDRQDVDNLVDALTEEEDEYLYPRDRDRDMATRPLSPASLCGSYFRAPDPDDPGAEAAWADGEACATVEGMVVAQPFASNDTVIYLVEFYGRHGATGYQRLVDLDRMLVQRWAFYDTEAWLTGQAEDTTRQREEA